MREPPEIVRRLCGVHTVSRWLVPLVLIAQMLLGAVPATAQSTLEVDAVTGVDGWIESTAPFELVVTVTSDVLFDGTVQATLGSVVIAADAQVPAGTTKVFRLTMPPPTTNGAVRVELVDSDGETAETTRITPRYPIEEVLVGVGSSGPREALDALRSPIVDRDVVAVAVDDRQPLGVFDYYVGKDLTERELAFVERGGVVITEDQPPSDAIPVADSGPARYRLRNGEILVTDAISDVNGYADLMIARSRRSGPLEFWQSPDQGLTDAATNAGEGGVPELPWLLGALIGYTVLIGPINFFVLKRLRRRDWAWLTIPAISLAALGVFWIVGGQRLSGADLSHATVIIGGDDPVERTSVVLAVGQEGSYTLAFNDVDIVYPATLGNRFDEFGRPIATAAGQVVGSEVRFDLQQLGFAGANSIGSPTVAPLSANWDASGRVDVRNDGDFGFWAWGVFDAGRITVTDETLAPGATLSLDTGQAGQGQVFEQEFGFFLGDAVINQLGLFDDRAWRVISPLGNAAQYALDDSVDRFVFGFSEDFRPDVKLDGEDAPSEGNALVVVPADAPSASGGSRSGRLLAIGSGFVEPQGGPGFEFVSTDEMWLGYRLPLGVSTATLEWLDQFGAGQLGQQVWDWESKTLADIGIGDEVGERFIDPGGNVVLRVGANRQEFEGGFVELPMSPQSFKLVWGER